MDLKLLALYFVIGGLTVASVTYFGSQLKGSVAAFLALLPSISVITFITIHKHGGLTAASSYAKSLLMLMPAWALYVGAILFLLPRVGLAGSLIAGIATYMAVSFILIRLV